MARAQNSQSALLDREVRKCVSNAEAQIRVALRLTTQARRDRSSDHARVDRVHRDLSRALGALQGVRHVAPLYDTNDPDFLPPAPYASPPPPVSPLDGMPTKVEMIPADILDEDTDAP